MTRRVCDIAQRRQGTANGQMLRRVVAHPQRQLHDRHIGLWVHHHQRRERAVVETTLGIEPRREPCALDQLPHLLGQRRQAGAARC